MITSTDKPNCEGGAKNELPYADQFTDLVQKACQGGDRSVILFMRRRMRANPELAKNNGDLETQIDLLDRPDHGVNSILPGVHVDEDWKVQARTDCRHQSDGANY
ncbi:MAG: hypothetical protein K0U90_02160 [Planctomycetes bacterium]|nr:hypothetical protein [Planctomycetota bacterium]